MQWYVEVLKKYAVFEGRSRRTEFWMFVLINFLVVALLTGIEYMLFETTALASIYQIAVFIPSIAVAVRRFHDIGKSGWWVLLGLIPCIGPLIIIFFAVQDSEPGSNQWGPNPKQIGTTEAY